MAIAIPVGSSSCSLGWLRILLRVGPKTTAPSFRRCPAVQFRNSLRPLAIVQIDPRPSEVIQIPPESKTGTGSFETLGFRSRGSVIIVGPLFARGRMRTQTEDGQLTGDQHFRDNLLILTPLKSRAGMNRVPACPARRSNQRIQTICVSSLVGVGHNLATRRSALAGVG